MIVKAFEHNYNHHINFTEKCIFINGVFDIFHLEHLRMINYAKRLYPNYKLVMAINSDKSVKEMGKAHPLIFDENYRSELLAELVDLVIIYDGFYDYLKIIEDFNVVSIIKGKEYEDKEIPEQDLGINIMYYGRRDKNVSSTNTYQEIIKKFKESTEI